MLDSKFPPGGQGAKSLFRPSSIPTTLFRLLADRLKEKIELLLSLNDEGVAGVLGVLVAPRTNPDESGGRRHQAVLQAPMRDVVLTQGDGMGITDEPSVSLTAQEPTEVLLIDMGPAPKPAVGGVAP